MTTPNLLDGLMLPYSIQLESGVIDNVLHITDPTQRNSTRFSYCHRLYQGTYLVQLTYTGPGGVSLSAAQDNAGWPPAAIGIPSGSSGYSQTGTTKIIVPRDAYTDLRMWCTDTGRHPGSLEIFPTPLYRKD